MPKLKLKEGVLKIVPWYCNATLYYIVPIEKSEEWNEDEKRDPIKFKEKWEEYETFSEEIHNLRVIIE